MDESGPEIPPASMAQSPQPAIAVKSRVQLFIVRGSANSRLAESNLRAFLTAHPELATDVEIIDFADQPDISLAAGVFVTPTLVRIAGEKSAVAVGNLQDQRILLDLLS
jgi:hypothetical protein